MAPGIILIVGIIICVTIYKTKKMELKTKEKEQYIEELEKENEKLKNSKNEEVD